MVQRTKVRSKSRVPAWSYSALEAVFERQLGELRSLLPYEDRDVLYEIAQRKRKVLHAAGVTMRIPKDNIPLLIVLPPYRYDVFSQLRIMPGGEEVRGWTDLDDEFFINRCREPRKPYFLLNVTRSPWFPGSCALIDPAENDNGLDGGKSWPWWEVLALARHTDTLNKTWLAAFGTGYKNSRQILCLASDDGGKPVFAALDRNALDPVISIPECKRRFI